MKKNWVLALVTWLVFAFLIGPLVIISITSFEPGSVLKFPPEGFSLNWYENIFKVSMFLETFKISILVSLAGNLMALLIGIPAAYALSRYDFKGKQLLNAVFISPVLIPGIVLGFTFLRYIIVEYGLTVYAGLFIGHTIIMLPF